MRHSNRTATELFNAGKNGEDIPISNDWEMHWYSRGNIQRVWTSLMPADPVQQNPFRSFEKAGFKTFPDWVVSGYV